MRLLGINLAMGILLIFTFGACERQGPPPKPIGSATNKHVEEAPVSPSRPDGNAMIQKMEKTTEEAQQAENLTKGEGDRLDQ